MFPVVQKSVIHPLKNLTFLTTHLILAQQMEVLLTAGKFIQVQLLSGWELLVSPGQQMKTGQMEALQQFQQIQTLLHTLLFLQMLQIGLKFVVLLLIYIPILQLLRWKKIRKFHLTIRRNFRLQMQF